MSPDARSLRVLGTVMPELREKILVLLDQMASMGCPMTVTDGNRTVEQQQKLYAKGRFGNPGKRVTNADGVRRKSNHQGGHAVDCTFLNALGKPHWPEPVRDPKTKKIVGPWALYGARAKALGLKWGGDFKSITDCPHVELPT